MTTTDPAATRCSVSRRTLSVVPRRSAGGDADRLGGGHDVRGGDRAASRRCSRRAAAARGDGLSLVVPTGTGVLRRAAEHRRTGRAAARRRRAMFGLHPRLAPLVRCGPRASRRGARDRPARPRTARTSPRWRRSRTPIRDRRPVRLAQPAHRGPTRRPPLQGLQRRRRRRADPLFGRAEVMSAGGRPCSGDPGDD